MDLKLWLMSEFEFKLNFGKETMNLSFHPSGKSGPPRWKE